MNVLKTRRVASSHMILLNQWWNRNQQARQSALFSTPIVRLQGPRQEESCLLRCDQFFFISLFVLMWRNTGRRQVESDTTYFFFFFFVVLMLLAENGPPTICSRSFRVWAHRSWYEHMMRRGDMFFSMQQLGVPQSLFWRRDSHFLLQIICIQ
jgi:hypothetical protein